MTSVGPFFRRLVGAFRWASWGLLGALLGRSWGLLGGLGGPPEAILEAIDQRRGGLTGSPRRDPKYCLLEASWAPLGASWSHPGALLGQFSRPLRPSWGSFRSLGGPLEAILEAIDQKGVDSFSLPPSGPSNGPLGALLGCSWALLRPSWGNLVPLLGASWDILESS